MWKNGIERTANAASAIYQVKKKRVSKLQAEQALVLGSMFNVNASRAGKSVALG